MNPGQKKCEMIAQVRKTSIVQRIPESHTKQVKKNKDGEKK
jgi:hypothetical protein